MAIPIGYILIATFKWKQKQKLLVFILKQCELEFSEHVEKLNYVVTTGEI